MRRVKIVMRSAGGALPALVATLIAPSIDACGARTGLGVQLPADARVDEPDTSVERDAEIVIDAPVVDQGAPDSSPVNRCTNGGFETIVTVTIPPAGTRADPGSLCAVAVQPALSSSAARVTLANYDPTTETADGFVAIPNVLQGSVIGTAQVTVVQASSPSLAQLQVGTMTKAVGGFSFPASWPAAVAHSMFGELLVVQTTLTISCADGGTETVQSTTDLEMCLSGDSSFTWVSSGDKCRVCEIIAEMAPTPIVSDNRGDELPLGRVISIRVVQLATAGRSVLLYCDNDAGDGAEYEWRVSGGRIMRVADDLVLWELPPEDAASSFGQVALWNENGAVVENFVWSAA